MRREWFSDSPEDTAAIAAAFSQTLRPGDCIAMFGDLGAGKTAFCGGLAKGLGVRSPVTSPTFTLVQEYHDGRLPLYHFDVYRLGGPEGLEDIGYYDYINGDGVCLVEWSELIESELPSDCYRLTMTILGEHRRHLVLER